VSDASRLFDLTDRVAIVTGGSRGLGREISLAYARAGADVIIASRKLESCQEAANEVTATTRRRALPVACHVGKWDDVDRLVETAYAEFGRVDVLVNNAGSSPMYESTISVSEKLFDSTIAINLKGAFRLTALVGERMAARDGGSVINVSSIASERPTVHEIPYAAAKAGLNNMTVAFAHALGPKVRVNAIVPGAFLTDISKYWDMENFNKMARRFDLRRAAEPREIIGAALFFASDASSYVTGALLHVDGGAR
jgi:NAD(P)-dependent dehydrogenase (short-subunit alcohol dehydrogenase family)